MRTIAVGAFIAALVAPVAGMPAAAVVPESGDPEGIAVVGRSGVVRTIGVPVFPEIGDAPPIVDIALSPTGEGYLVLDRRGKTRARGDARPFGTANAPSASVSAAALALAPGGTGAYVAFEDGTVRALGAAAPIDGLSRSAGRHRADPVVDLALAPGSGGLWLLTRSGRIVSLGGAQDLDAAPASDAQATGLAVTPTGHGAWVARTDGSVAAVGDAVGDRGPRAAGAPSVTGIAPLGVTDDWILVDIDGNVERRGEDPEPMPGTGGGIVAIDTLAGSPGVTSGGPDAPDSTKVVAPALVLGTEGDPAGMLVVRMPGLVVGPPLPLEVGDVFATAIGPNTPNGLLRRILAIEVLGDGSVALTTGPATLSDALDRGELSLGDDLADLVVPDFTPTTGDGTVEPAEPTAATPYAVRSVVATAEDIGAPVAAAGAVGTIAEPGRFTYGCDGDDTGYELKVKPVFSLNPDVTLGGNWGDQGEFHLRAGAGLQGELGAEFTATGAVVCEASFALVDDLSLGKKLVFVGPVPIVVEPELSIGAKLSGKAEAEATASASSTGTVSAVLTVDREAGFDAFIVDLQPDSAVNGHLEGELGGSIEASFALSPSIGFLLYGVVAPTVSVETGLTMKYELCESPNLTLVEPAALEVGLKPSEWFGEMLEAFDVFDIEATNTFALPGSPYPLYSSDIASPLPCGDTTDLPDGRVGVAYATSIPLDLPSGATDPTYAVEAGSTLPPGLSLTGDGTLAGTPTQSGVFTFDISASHTLGITIGSFRLTILQADVLAISTTELPGGTVDEAYTFTLQANRPADELVWTLTGGDLPAGISLDPDGTLSGTPTAAGNFPITIQASHADSGQTDEELFNLPVTEDIGGAIIGSTSGDAVADVGPDGSVAAILFDANVEDEDGISTAGPRRLVGIGADGVQDYLVELPGICAVDPICLNYHPAKAAVGLMPDGGAAVAFARDGAGVLARYGPTGDEIWALPLPFGERSQISALEVAPDGRIAVATVEGDPWARGELIDCGSDLYGGWSGMDLMIVDATGDNLGSLHYELTLSCADVTAGTDLVSVGVAGITVDEGGAFVVVGSRDWSGARPDESFLITEGLTILDVTAPGPIRSIGSSGERLFVAIHDQPTACGIAIGELVGTVVTATGPSVICGSGAGDLTLTGRAGVANSLIARWDYGWQLERWSDAGASLGARSLPDDRAAIAITVGSGGQLFAVEQEWGQSVDGSSPIVRRVLNPDLSDQAP